MNVTQDGFSPLETGLLTGTLVVLCPIVFLVVFGNLLVIIAIIVNRTLRKPQNIYFVSLAIVDLSVGVLVLPINILNIVRRGWTLGRVVCKFYVTLDVTLCTMSVLHLCAIAVDRYRAINDGIHYIQQRTFKTSFVAVAGIAIMSIWISSPPVLGWDESWMKDVEMTKDCHLVNSRGYVVYSAFASFIFPMVLMLYLYFKIYYALRRRIRERARIKSIAPASTLYCNGAEGKIKSMPRSQSLDNILDESGGPSTETSTSSETGISAITSNSNGSANANGAGTLKFNFKYNKKESSVSMMSQQVQDFVAAKKKFSLTKQRNAARTYGIIMGAFIVCWLPFSVVYVSTPFLPESYKPPHVVFEVLSWLGYVNCALNPIIYTVCKEDFRNAFKKILNIKK